MTDIEPITSMQEGNLLVECRTVNALLVKNALDMNKVGNTQATYIPNAKIRHVFTQWKAKMQKQAPKLYVQHAMGCATVDAHCYDKPYELRVSTLQMFILFLFADGNQDAMYYYELENSLQLTDNLESEVLDMCQVPDGCTQPLFLLYNDDGSNFVRSDTLIIVNDAFTSDLETIVVYKDKLNCANEKPEPYFQFKDVEHIITLLLWKKLHSKGGEYTISEQDKTSWNFFVTMAEEYKTKCANFKSMTYFDITNTIKQMEKYQLVRTNTKSNRTTIKTIAPPKRNMLALEASLDNHRQKHTKKQEKQKLDAQKKKLKEEKREKKQGKHAKTEEDQGTTSKKTDKKQHKKKPAKQPTYTPTDNVDSDDDNKRKKHKKKK